jgi:hypothetical protein
MALNLDEILAAALCPASLFDDVYDTFLRERSALLASEANTLQA